MSETVSDVLAEYPEAVGFVDLLPTDSLSAFRDAAREVAERVRASEARRSATAPPAAPERPQSGETGTGVSAPRPVAYGTYCPGQPTLESRFAALLAEKKRARGVDSRQSMHPGNGTRR